VPIFMKLSVTKYTTVDISCTEIYPHQIKNVADTSKI